jgi:hypothetical protein
MYGHRAIGFDTDPLAILISRVWSSDVDASKTFKRAQEALESAKKLHTRLTAVNAYPQYADRETRDFVRYWFDLAARKQLAALAISIDRTRDSHIRSVLWCAYSRMIVTKKIGVSLAWDVSHSRPHRVYDRAPVLPWDSFLSTVEKVLMSIPFIYDGSSLPRSRIAAGDARDLPLASNTVDVVVTSPPYLNAIDYLRGHKMSLVWMGYKISDLRLIRSNNVGAECMVSEEAESPLLDDILCRMTDVRSLDSRLKSMLRRYLQDLERFMIEIVRVLKRDGEAIIVIGDSGLRNVFVCNSYAVRVIAESRGLSLISNTTRSLPDNRRYLPPPSSKSAGIELGGRMREEVILKFRA